MDRHIAFVSLPGHGHVNPTLPLVAELVRRGWRVSYATARAVRPGVEEPARRWSRRRATCRRRRGSPTSTRTRFAGSAPGFVADARVDVPRLEAHFRRDPPQAVCYDSASLTGRVLAGRPGPPTSRWCPTSPATSGSRRSAASSRRHGADQPAPQRPGRRCRSYSPPSRAWSRRRARWPGRPASLNIVFVPPEFQPAADTFDERFRFVGPSPGRARTTRRVGPRRTSRCCSSPSARPSTTARSSSGCASRRSATACGRSRWRWGTGSTPTTSAPVPGNVDVRPWFPQPAVLRHAARVRVARRDGLDDGGAVLRRAAGVRAADARAGGQRRPRRGAGPGCPARPGGPDRRRPARRRRRRHGDDAMRAALDRMRDAVREAGGAVAAADAIEAHLAA